MRKVILSLTVYCIAGTFVALNSCKKESSQNSSPNAVTIAKVNTWLDEQKKGKLPKKADNIELLKNNLNFSDLRFEKSENGEQFIIIPINERFKETTHIDKNSVTDLVLTLNKLGDIRNGNVVLYRSENGQTTEIPGNALYHIFNTAKPECNGKFQFLSVTGRPLYQLEYKDKNLVSSGIFQSKENSAKSGRMSPVCYDWYLVTTYYDQSGAVVAQTTQYLYTTCNEESGGGGGESITCCISDPNAQLISRAVSELGANNCGPETKDKLTGLPIKTCTHIWVFNRSSLLFYSWQYTSIEQVVEEKVGGVWRFKSLPTHSGMNTSGNIPPCINTSVSITAAVPWLSTDKSTASMELYYTQSFTVLCIPKLSGGSNNHYDRAQSQWVAI